jgi:acetylornithine deacetylase
MTRTLEILDRLVTFPSVSAASNLAIIDLIEGILGAAGAEVHRIGDPTGAKAGLFARVGPADRAGVMLSGHTDVVPVAGQVWTADPFRLRRDGERLYGRGATDMKGFLACMLSAAERAAALPLTEPLKLAFSWDEEVGCLGIPQMLPEMEGTIGTPRLCIVGEPTSMQIALGHKGKVALRATCHGTAGHSSMAPDYLNAIHLAGDFVTGLRRLQADLAATGARDADYDIPYATVHAGRIEGGTALNIVPDRAVIDFEYRYPANQLPEAVQSALTALAEEVAAAHGGTFAEARVEVDVMYAYPGLGMAPDHPAVALMQSLVPGAKTTKVAFGTEAGHFDAAGVPTLVCGPGSMEQGHKPDEFIESAELARCDAMCDRLLAHLCGGA